MVIWYGIVIGGMPVAEVQNSHGINEQQAFTQLVRVFTSSKGEQKELLRFAERTVQTQAESLKGLGAQSRQVEVLLWRHINNNLRLKVAKQATPGVSFTLNASALKRTVIGYEAFKLQTFLTSGVFPKRYFGYFDEQYDTKDYERQLKQTVSEVVAVINREQARRKAPIRLTDIEVAVTYIAEGGAIFLREHQNKLQRLHPVLDVGLDDLALGLAQHPELALKIDKTVGTGLSNLVGTWQQGQSEALRTIVPNAERWLKGAQPALKRFPYLRRYMTFQEAIVGTALMYLWEKEIAAAKLKARGLKALHRRPLREQFIIASLVYNCGQTYDYHRWPLIERFTTARWIYQRSERNAKRRWRLNVLPEKPALRQLLTVHQYPVQPTAWLAAYHILQRYGALVALQQFTEHFDQQGFFRFKTKSTAAQ